MVDKICVKLNATKLAIAAFIVPYVFALNPEMLFIDTTVPEVVLWQRMTDKRAAVAHE